MSSSVRFASGGGAGCFVRQSDCDGDLGHAGGPVAQGNLYVLDFEHGCLVIAVGHGARKATSRDQRRLSPAKIGPALRHQIAQTGVPFKAAQNLLSEYRFVGRPLLLTCIGVSERTFQRGFASDKSLDENASDRAMRLAVVTEQATDILGSREAAEKWLVEPAVGLDRQSPIDMLKSEGGTELVKTLLTRMDFGVYS